MKVGDNLKGVYCKKAVLESEARSGCNIIFSGGRIDSITNTDIHIGGDIFDASHFTVIPGLVDIHVHGMEKYLVAKGNLQSLCDVQVRHGVTCWTPTIFPDSPEDAVSLLNVFIPEAAKIYGGAKISGFYLEGPSIAQPGASLTITSKQINLKKIKQVLDAGQGMVRVYGLSPELPGAMELIDELVRRDITASICHTKAQASHIFESARRGVKLATHLFDVYEHGSVIDGGVYPAGAVEAILVCDSITAEIICDGTHVHPVNLELARRSKGTDRIALITDGQIGAGLPSGEYITKWERKVRVTAFGGARDTKEGFLSGSGLSMMDAVKGAVEIMKVSLIEAVHMGSSVPARVIGLGNRKGKIAGGFDADLVVIDEQYNIISTIVSGKIAYLKQ